MGAKKPAAGAANKKPRVEGVDITRFFDRHHADKGETHAHIQPHEAGTGRLVSPPSGGGGGQVAAGPAAADRTPAGPAPRPAAPPKQLSALHDLCPADSFAMSQDTDAMQVVWQDSPGSSSRPMARSLSNLGRGTGISGASSAPGSGPQELHAIKQRLISAAQRTRDARRPAGGATGFAAAGGAARLQQSEQLLEGLLMRPQPPAAAAAGAGASSVVATQELSALSGGLSDLGPCVGGGGGGGQHRTPGTGLRGILKRRGSNGAGSAGRQTPASSVQFTLNGGGSTIRKGRRGDGGQAGSSGKKRQAGQKRKALLELLEQVENIVHSSGSPETAEAKKEEAAASGDAAELGGQASAAAAEAAGTVNDKENAAAANGKLSVVCSHRQASEEAVAAAGPSGSQQLMPPPGGLHNCGARQQQQSAAHPLHQQQQQKQPSAQAQQQQHQQSAAPPGPAAVQQGAGSGGGASGGYGFADDSDEDDVLMAQLELELLTQVESRQVAKQAQGGAAAAGAARQGPGAAKAAVAASAAAPPRPQAAPPAAQHPAAVEQQQQQQQQQSKALPRSPYDKRPLPSASVVVPAGGGAPLQPESSALQGSDSSWEDDLDATLLDQFEEAALKERADRNSGQAAGGGGSSEGQPGAANQQQQQQQPAVADGGPKAPGGGTKRPSYPGNREEIHYTIKEIFPGQHEQVLLVHNKYQKRDVYAHLHAPWSDLPYQVGDPVNILADLDFFEGHHHCLLNMERGMLILHPDVLLSGTRITTSNECPRRSFLDERVAGDGSNDKAVKGTLTHNLIQTALTEGLRSPPQLLAAAERVVREATEALLEVELTEEAAMECLRQAVPGIIRWMHRFLRADPAPDALLGAGMDYATGRDVQRLVAVNEVLDIEESIWSTKYGVKGMIDVSAQLTLDNPSQQRPGAGGTGGWMQQQAAAQGAQSSREVAVGPVEIKTGKMHESHKAQVLLYLLLMEERYGRPLDWGMLWYTTQPDPNLVKKRPTDLSCLMAVRNRLAAAIARREMPTLSDEKRQCNWCFQQLNCALAHKAELGAAAASADTFVRASTDRGGNLDRWQQDLAGKYERAVGHMEPADCEFLKKWEALITLEEGHCSARRPDIWAMPGDERQAQGRCVAGLVLSHVDEEQLLYTFCRPGGGAVQCGFQEGEMLLLSVEGQHVAVARGFFYTCSATQLTLSLNKPLRKGLLEPSGTPPGAPAITAAAARGGGSGSSVQFDGGVQWRLDRDEVSSTYVRLRGNLFALFRREFEPIKDPQTGRTTTSGPELDQSLQAARLRQLVVALDAPRYTQPDPTQPDPTPAGMNSEQHVAVQRVLCAQDYTLVLGMPGAGKTTTIVSMVQALVSQGKSVLLTSYTNSAVDNILMKLAREEVPFVRLGRESGVHPAVRPWVPGGERYPRKTTRELAAIAERVPVVGATCFGVHHAMLKNKLFDVCIIDEAGQMVLPASLGPLLKARSFVLVGDHNQLPPLVISKEAEAGGLVESLFKRLSDAHPQAVVQLPVQYRMAADIMLLPNTLIYNNALRCGTDGVAQGALRLSPGASATLGALPAWLQAALDPQRRVLFLDTAHVDGARESVAGDALSNSGEAALVVRVLQAAVAAGVAQGDLGVISPYRSQVALLDRLARQTCGLEGVEVLTVDKCQGRDKECIVLSLVRSNADGEAGKLLADWRRINVAITRAKTKLLLVGDASTLRAIELFARLVALTKERGWYLQLPQEAAVQARAALPPQQQ